MEYNRGVKIEGATGAPSSCLINLGEKDVAVGDVSTCEWEGKISSQAYGHERGLSLQQPVSTRSTHKDCLDEPSSILTRGPATDNDYQ